MTTSNEAVEAAAKAVHDEFCRDPYHAGFIGPACYDYKDEARTILEAAAGYIIQEAKADAWDEGSQARWDYQWRDDIEPLTNPYRNQS